MHSTIELTDLDLALSLGTYGAGDVVPTQHLLDLTLTIDASLVMIDADRMDRVFDYDPLIREIDRIAQDGHYETQEWLMTRIVHACTRYVPIQSVEVMLRKAPVLRDSGHLGVRLHVDATTFAELRAALRT